MCHRTRSCAEEKGKQQFTNSIKKDASAHSSHRKMSSTDHEQVTSFGDDGEKVIVASVLTNVDLTRVDIDAMDSLIENSADLLRKYSGTDECLQEMFTFPDAYKIFLIVSSPFVATLLPKVHDLPVLQSVYIYGEALEDEEAKKYTKVSFIRCVSETPREKRRSRSPVCLRIWRS